MLSTILSVLRDPVPYRGGLGIFAIVTLERLNAFVGLMVGIATLIYLCLRIRKEWRGRNAANSKTD